MFGQTANGNHSKIKSMFSSLLRCADRVDLANFNTFFTWKCVPLPQDTEYYYHQSEQSCSKCALSDFHGEQSFASNQWSGATLRKIVVKKATKMKNLTVLAYLSTCQLPPLEFWNRTGSFLPSVCLLRKSTNLRFLNIEQQPNKIQQERRGWSIKSSPSAHYPQKSYIFLMVDIPRTHGTCQTNISLSFMFFCLLTVGYYFWRVDWTHPSYIRIQKRLLRIQSVPLCPKRDRLFFY